MGEALLLCLRLCRPRERPSRALKAVIPEAVKREKGTDPARLIFSATAHLRSETGLGSFPAPISVIAGFWRDSRSCEAVGSRRKSLACGCCPQLVSSSHACQSMGRCHSGPRM